MSFSAIGAILKKATEENETSKEQTEMMSQAAKAYKFFSDGKSYYANTCEYDIHEVCHLSSTLWSSISSDWINVCSFYFLYV